jgi:replication factor A2
LHKCFVFRFCLNFVFQWKDESAGAWVRDQQELCTPGSYARIFGQLRVYQNIRSITVHRIRPLDDMNEITYHMAAVMVSSVGESVTRMPSFSSPVQAAGGVKFEQNRAGVSSMGMGAGVSPADRYVGTPASYNIVLYLL